MTLIDELKSLLEADASESRTLEFKRKLNLSELEGRGKFAAEYSSFLNDMGGKIYVGVSETNTGFKITGFECNNIDRFLQTIDNIIIQNIEPHAPPPKSRHEQLPSGKYVLELEINQSYLRPHREKYKLHFYTRNSQGKNPMDIHNIKQAFLTADNQQKKIEEFERKRKLEINEEFLPGFTPDSISYLLVHCIPISSFHQDYAIQSTDLKQALQDNVGELSGFIGRVNINYDGAILWNGPSAPNNIIKLYRNGTSEFFFPAILNPKELVTLQFEILNAFAFSRIFSKSITIPAPYFISAYINICNGHRFKKPNGDGPTLIRLGHYKLPTLYVESQEEVTPSSFRPMFDVLWNIFGTDRCPYFDDNDNYTFSLPKSWNANVS